MIGSLSSFILSPRADPLSDDGKPVPSPFSTTETDWLHYVTLIASGLSTLGNLFILYCFIIFRKRLAKNYLSRLVCFLSIANTLLSISWFISVTAVHFDSGLTMCSITGGLVFYACLSGLAWVVAIATENTWRFSRAVTPTFGEKEINHRPYMPRELFYHVVAWILPLAFYIDLLVDDRVGLGRFIGCWFKSNQRALTISFMTLVAFSVIYCAVAYIIFICSLKSTYEASGGLYYDNRNELVVVKARGGLYLVVYVFCWTFYILFEIVYGLNDVVNSWVYVLALVTSAVMPLAGFLNALVYGCRWDLIYDIQSHLTSVTSHLMFCRNCKRPAKNKKKRASALLSITVTEGANDDADSETETTYVSYGTTDSREEKKDGVVQNSK